MNKVVINRFPSFDCAPPTAVTGRWRENSSSFLEPFLKHNSSTVADKGIATLVFFVILLLFYLKEIPAY